MQTHQKSVEISRLTNLNAVSSTVLLPFPKIYLGRIYQRSLLLPQYCHSSNFMTSVQDCVWFHSQFQQSVKLVDVGSRELIGVSEIGQVFQKRRNRPLQYSAPNRCCGDLKCIKPTVQYLLFDSCAIGTNCLFERAAHLLNSNVRHAFERGRYAE